MRFQGRITEWNDERGFGFVTPNGGGERAFLHIKSFKSRRKRPTVDQLVKYTLEHDAKGRPRAEAAEFVSLQRVSKNRRDTSSRWRVVLAVAFLLVVAVLVVSRKVPAIILLVYPVISCITYIAYATDKSAAKQGRWRTPENTLQVLALLGGWPGGLVAQQVLHHKNRKTSFQFTFWLMVIINVIALGWLTSSAGIRFITSLS